MALQTATNMYQNSRYIVGAGTAPYATIQAALNAANAAGGNATVYVRTGTYTENLTLYNTVDIEGTDNELTVIVGTHTPPATGSCALVRAGFQSTTNILSSAVAGSATIRFTRCRFTVTNGYIFNLPNWTGQLRVRYCNEGSSTSNGVVNNAGAASIILSYSQVGAGTANAMTINGALTSEASTIGCPITISGSATSTLFSSYLQGTVTVSGTAYVKIENTVLTTGATTAIVATTTTPMLLSNLVINTSNAFAISGTGSILFAGVNFVNSKGISGTIVESLDGVTKTGEIYADTILRMGMTGFYSWAAAGPYFSDITLGTFNLLVGGTGYIQGKKVTWVAQNITGLTQGNTWWIYIDSTGTIGKTSTRTDALFVNNIVLFECLYDSTPTTAYQYTVKENHPYSYQVGVSNYEHDVIGAVIENVNNGANITLNGTQKIAISGADVLADHGLDTTIPDSGGVAVSWYKMYTTAAGKWARQNFNDTFLGYWNNAGTPTLLTGGAGLRYAVYTLYASKDSLNTTTPTYFAVLNTAAFNTAALANTAINNGTTAKASNELASLELCQLGYIIYEQATTSIVQVIISKATLKQTLSTAGASTAALINTNTANFDGILSSADTTVQAALETIDDYGKWVNVTGTSASMTTRLKYIANNASLVTLTLPTVAAQGDTFEVVGYGAGMWKIAQNANQIIHMLSTDTTTGVTGYVQANNRYASIYCVCTVANLEWVVKSSMGNLTVA